MMVVEPIKCRSRQPHIYRARASVEESNSESNRMNCVLIASIHSKLDVLFALLLITFAKEPSAVKLKVEVLQGRSLL